jgi:tetratricopeptide (TPR) repeat protein
LPDEYGIAFARSNLGQVAKWEGDYSTAISHFQKSLELWKELRHRGFWSAGNIVDALAEIGHVYQAMGDHMQAFNYLSQAMEMAKTLLNRNRMAGVLNDIGVVCIEQGDYLKASESLNEAPSQQAARYHERERLRRRSKLRGIA